MVRSMELNRDICYRALKTRDPRFDGRFFTGVRTTGIYCRPVCPAVTPKAVNLDFYPCAAAAEQAGFRPCKRCRPETSPGTPAWLGTSATVSRALRLIGEGALDVGSVDDLADRLGVGSRHLARLFGAHLGATPVAVAQTRRVHFARNLVEQTELPMTQVAMAAGFGSLRRFNTLVKRTFGDTPTVLRRRTGKPAGAGFCYRLPYREPYDWEGLLAFLSVRAVPSVEAVEDGCYRRTIRWGDAVGTLTARPGGPGHLLLTVDPPELGNAIALVDRARRMFDCGADPAAINAHLGRDPLLAASVARRPGLRLPCAWDPFELAVRAIVGQQISVAGARTIAGRLVDRCGRAVDGDLNRVFPSAAELADANLDDLGLTTQRIATLKGMARAVVDGAVDLTAPLGPDAFSASMVRLPGIGPWTAHYIAMRALGEPDAFPASDLGLRKAAPDIDLVARAESWRPWRAYAALHLWASLGDEP